MHHLLKTNSNKSHPPDEATEAVPSFTRRVWLTVGVVTIVFIILFLLWHALKIIFALFGGILFGILLHGLSCWLSDRTGLSAKTSLFLTLGLLILLLVGGGWLLIPNVVDQITQLGDQLRTSLNQVESQLSASQPGQMILDQINAFRPSGNSTALFSQASDIFSSTINAFVYAAIILFVGIYLAYEPKMYVNGLLQLAPIERRPRYHEALDKAAYALRWWLVGRFTTMVVVGTLSVVGLMLLGIPLAFVLGLLAGLLAFIPIFGPVIALVPPLLIAFTESPQKALYVFLLYVGIQIVETYILTPLVQKQATSLPPVLLIGSQVLLNLFAGLLGVMMAAPMAVTGMVLVKMLYVEDVLDDHNVSYEDEADTSQQHNS